MKARPEKPSSCLLPQDREFCGSAEVGFPQGEEQARRNQARTEEITLGVLPVWVHRWPAGWLSAQEVSAGNIHPQTLILGDLL